jgi:hypothetical protein
MHFLQKADYSHVGAEIAGAFDSAGQNSDITFIQRDFVDTV